MKGNFNIKISLTDGQDSCISLRPDCQTGGQTDIEGLIFAIYNYTCGFSSFIDRLTDKASHKQQKSAIYVE